MTLSIDTPRLQIVSFTQAHVSHPNYIEWLTDRDNLISLNLIDYLITPVTQDGLVRYFESFQSSVSNHLFAIHLV